MFAITASELLIERGHEVHLLCYPGSKIEITANEKGIKTLAAKANSYFHPVIITKLANRLRKENYDLIHTQASKDLWVLTPALNISGLHAPLYLTKQVGSFIVKKDFLHKLIYKRVTKVFAISEVIRKNVIDTTPVDESRVVILHNGIISERFDPAKSNRNKVREEFNIKENEIVLGMLARFSWGKGHEEFLLAAKELVSEFNNVKFMIVGEPSRGEEDYANKIKQLSKEYGLTDKVIFTGFRSDTPDVLSAMDVFVFPSHSEAFGIALVEAMAMELPTVCSNSDGVLDITVDGETGFLFEKQNAYDLATKAKLLIQDKNLRTTLGKNARKRALQLFDLNKLTDKVIKIYEADLGQKS